MNNFGDGKLTQYTAYSDAREAVFICKLVSICDKGYDAALPRILSVSISCGKQAV